MRRSDSLECKILLKTSTEMISEAGEFISSRQTGLVTWHFRTTTQTLQLVPRGSNQLSNSCTFVVIFDNSFSTPILTHWYIFEQYSFSSSVTFILVTQVCPPLHNPKAWITLPAHIYVHIWNFVTLTFIKTSNRYRTVRKNIFAHPAAIENGHNDLFGQPVEYFLFDGTLDESCANTIRRSNKFSFAISDRSCDPRKLEFLFLRTHFNFTLALRDSGISRRGEFSPRIVSMVRYTVDYASDEVAAMVLESELRGGIIYCKKHFIFGTANATMAVWISPFDTIMWILIIAMLPVLGLNGISLETLASPWKTGKRFVYQIYIVFSILLRNGVRDYRAKMCLFGLLSQLIPCLYESLITGKLIVPEGPKPFDGIVDFVRNSYTIRYDVTSYDNDLIRYDPSMIEVFRKAGILDKIDTAFDYIPMDLVNRFEIYRLAANLPDEKERNAYYAAIRAEAQNSLREELEILVRHKVEDNRFYCHIYGVGDILRFYWFFFLPNTNFVLRAHNLIQQAGIYRMWEGMWENYEKLVLAGKKFGWGVDPSQRRTPETTIHVLGLDNLTTFFVIWGFLLLFPTGAFVGEIFYYLVKLLFNYFT